MMQKKDKVRCDVSPKYNSEFTTIKSKTQKYHLS